jgi:hypothetical protein
MTPDLLGLVAFLGCCFAWFLIGFQAGAQKSKDTQE